MLDTVGVFATAHCSIRFVRHDAVVDLSNSICEEIIKLYMVLD
jgi:hypothetical protein